jgi:hypothetical protein
MKSSLAGILILASTLGVAGCSCGENFTKGTIVMRTETESYINLGYDDGILMGDTLNVWRNQSIGKTTRNVNVGKVKVVKILDKNHSAVEAVKGNLNELDIVEKHIP